MRSYVQKWGNSLAIRIPKPFAEESDLSEGVAVSLTLRNGKLIIEPDKEVFDVDDLLEKITKKNIHRETETGGPVGNEIW